MLQSHLDLLKEHRAAGERRLRELKDLSREIVELLSISASDCMDFEREDPQALAAMQNRVIQAIDLAKITGVPDGLRNALHDMNSAMLAVIGASPEDSRHTAVLKLFEVKTSVIHECRRCIEDLAPANN